MMPLTRDEFLKRATDCGLVTGEVVAAIVAGLPPDAQPQDGEQLSRELVRQNKLTKFQAEQICAGRGNSLTLGNYVILDKLGQGGMGMVLKAEHKRMKRLVAIKVMSPTAVKTPDALKRFHREVEAAAKLRHPNIVAADDADEAKGTHFLVMEYVEGSDLSVLVRKHGPLSVEQAIRCIIQAARGLEFAHEQGVIHRDIKPANLLIDAKGTVKILDMGLARIDSAVGGSSEGAGLTNTGTIMGTVDYMSPEQAMDTKHADARSDIYSLGISLYYLLTGKVAYVGDTMMKKLMAHQNAPIPPLSSPHAPREESRTSLDPRSDKTSSGVDGSPAIISRSDTATLTALDTVFRRMVAKRPEDRPQSMTQVIAELECCLSGGGTPTLVFEPNSNTATAGLSAGRGNGLQPFLRQISGDGGTSATSASPSGAKGTAVVPSSADGETMISTADEAGTDPQTQTMLATETRSRTMRWRGFAVGLLACVVLAGIIIKLTKKDGTTLEATVPDGTKKVEIKESEISNSKSQISNSKGWHDWPVDAPAPAIAPFDAEQANKHQEAWAKYLGVPVEYTNSIGMKFVLIPPGEFTMGSTAAEIEAGLKETDASNKEYQDGIKSEAPQHKVILTQPIYLGMQEVTQGNYEKVMGVNPAKFATAGAGKEALAEMDTNGYPVEMVSWNDAAEFCAKLSQQEQFEPCYLRDGETITPLNGTGYRLPTEAQWEFACHAGTTTQYWIGDKDEDLAQAGWFRTYSGGRTHAAGKLKANPFGLFDMHGNVFEWMQDWWEPTYYGEFTEMPAKNPNGSSSGSRRVLRGGDWRSPSFLCRASHRSHVWPVHRAYDIGFRVSLTVEAVRAALAIKPPPAKSPFDASQAKAHQAAWAKHLGVPVEYTNSIGMKFRLIPPGEFTRGSTASDIEAALKDATQIKWAQEQIQSEAPQHKVTLTQPLYLGVHEVTQAQYQKVTGKNPSHFASTSDGKEAVMGMDTNNHPVETVSWNDAAEFCAQLSQQEKLKPFYFRTGETVTQLSGTGYRLPTEAEWEFACRAGTTTRYWSGDEDLSQTGWFGKNSGLRTHTVGELKDNPFGLYDVHGNVWEWAQDWWDRTHYEQFQVKPALDPNGPAGGSHRVARGGGYNFAASGCLVSSRAAPPPTSRFGHLGFRVALTTDAVRNAVAQRPLPAIAPFDAKQARAHQEAWARHLGTTVETVNSVGAKMILIPPGEFLMGSTPKQIAAAKKMAEDEKMFAGDYYWTRLNEEAPQHPVTITRPFWMGRTEVTVAQFRKFVESSKYVTEAEKYGAGNSAQKSLNEKVKDADKGLNWKSPGYPSSDDAPVTQVSWNDACAYCMWLSEQEKRTPWYQSDGQGGWKFAAQGDGYRLPTEAEWEYACRAGTTTLFSFGDDVSLLGQYAWYGKNLAGKPQPVALKLPNPFGLYDVHGNIWEWCHDLFNRESYAKSSPRDPLGGTLTNTDHVNRGGYWTYAASYCRSAYRGSSAPSHRSKQDGFRVVRVQDAATTKSAAK